MRLKRKWVRGKLLAGDMETLYIECAEEEGVIYDRGMREGLILVMVGLLAVLLESTLLAWPFVVLFIWWSERADERLLVILMVILGVILDGLQVRWLGVSSLALLGYWVVLRFLRVTFAGAVQLEIIWTLIISGVWYVMLGERGGWGEMILMGIIFFVVMIGGENLKQKEIRLK